MKTIHNFLLIYGFLCALVVTAMIVTWIFNVLCGNSY